MNVNELVGGGLALPFLKRPEARQGLPLAKKISKPARGHIVAFIGELLGTFLFLFLSFAGVANSQTPDTSDVVTPALYISISFGFALLVNAWTFFRISGGLFNPAVTWGMCLIGALSWFRGSLVLVAQILGAIIAAALIRALYPGKLDVRTTIGEGTSLTQAFFIETIMTFQLVLVIFLLAAEKHKATFIAPIGIGLALFSGMLASVRYTGASMNPARSFGPAVAMPGFHYYDWIYWVAPLLGSTIAVLVYKVVKALEYESANPGQDDTGEKKVVVSDNSNESSNTEPQESRQPRRRTTSSQSRSRHGHRSLDEFGHGRQRRDIRSTTFSSGPEAESGYIARR